MRRRKWRYFHPLPAVLALCLTGGVTTSQELLPVSPIDSTTKINVMFGDDASVYDLRQRQDESLPSNMDLLGIPVFPDRYACAVAKRPDGDTYTFVFPKARGLLAVTATRDGAVDVGVVGTGGETGDVVSDCLQISTTRRKDEDYPLKIGTEEREVRMIPNLTVGLGNASLWISFPEENSYITKSLPALSALTADFGCPVLHTMAFEYDDKIVYSAVLRYGNESNRTFLVLTMLPSGEKITFSYEIRETLLWDIDEMEGPVEVIE